MSVAELTGFIKQAESSNYVPTKSAIIAMGNAMVKAAAEDTGYKDLVWKAGIYLLILASENSEINADEFFANYGISAIANALGASLKSDFPAGLSFIVYEFIPNNDLEGIIQDERIRSLLSHGITLDPKRLIENLRDSTYELRRAATLFVDACRSNEITVNDLAMAAALVVSSPDLRKEPHVVRFFLDGLAARNQDICLFYSWRAAAANNPELWKESSYICILPEVLRRISIMEQDAVPVLVDIFEDTHVISALVLYENLLALFGMAGWWVYVEHEQAQGLDVTWRFILAISSKYPHWAEAMRSYLQGKQYAKISPKKVEQLQTTFKSNMQRLRERSRLRSYRGVPLALQIQRHNLVNIFEPLYEALEGSSTIIGSYDDRMRSLNAFALIDENPLQKASLFPITGDLRAQMTRDYDEIISLLHETLTIKQQLDKGEILKSEKQKNATGVSPLKLEIDSFLNQFPELQWAVERFMPIAIYSQ